MVSMRKMSLPEERKGAEDSGLSGRISSNSQREVLVRAAGPSVVKLLNLCGPLSLHL